MSTRTKKTTTRRKTATVVARNVTALGVSRLVVLAMHRQSPRLIGDLMRMSLTELIAHVVSLGPEDLTDEEIEHVTTRMSQIEHIARRELSELKLALSSNGLSACGAATKDKLALILHAAGDPPIRTIDLDEGQERAARIALTAPRTVIVAGPGAGKTTTVCGIAARAAESGKRVAILAFNVAAARVTTNRLRSFRNKASILSQDKAVKGDAPGITVMTFNKYVFQFRERRGWESNASVAGGGVRFGRHPAYVGAGGGPGGGGKGSYDRALERGIDLGAGSNEHWDVLIIDEAQDVQNKHVRLIEQLIPLVRGHVVVAGDPRQELYTGASWFSNLVADSRAVDLAEGHDDEEPTQTPWGVVHLENNHRSTPGIIAALNAASRILFPTLHYDQRPPGASPDWESAYTPANGFGGCVEWVIGGQHTGDEVAELLRRHQSRESVAISPVTLDKWANGAVVASVMNNVYASGSDRMVLTLGRGTVLDDYAYFIGTARTAKGTEREHVVLFGMDKNYMRVISRAAVCKMLYVSLSRARSSITIVLNDRVGPDFLLTPLVPQKLRNSTATTPPMVVPSLVSESAVSISTKSFWEHGRAGAVVDRALDSVQLVDGVGPVETRIDTRYADVEEARSHVPDADIVGLVVEATIAAHLGFDLGRIDAVRPARVSTTNSTLVEEMIGVLSIRKRRTGWDDENEDSDDEEEDTSQGGRSLRAGRGRGYEVVYDPRKVRGSKNEKKSALDLFEKELWAFIRENADKHPAYAYVILQVSSTIGRMWTMSERLRSLDLVEQCRPWAEVIDAHLRPRPEIDLTFDDDEDDSEKSGEGDGDKGGETDDQQAEKTGGDASLVYQPSGYAAIFAHRSSTVAGRVMFAADLISTSSGGETRVTEIKHVRQFEREHVAQACIYATLLGSASTHLVNTNAALFTPVDAMNPLDFNDRVRALYAMQIARFSRINRDAKGLTRSLPHLRAYLSRPLVFVDIETGRRIGMQQPLITEVGAVCINLASQDMVIDTFHRLGRGVIELEREAKKTSRQLGAEVARGSEDAAQCDDAEPSVEFEDEEEAEEPERIGSGAGTPSDPWIPFAPAALGVTNVPALIDDQERLCRDFRRWLTKSLPSGAIIVQWAGRDAQALGLCGEFPDLDAHHMYKWYLESTGARRVTGTTLEHAVIHLLGPSAPFEPHRAFEDAVMTAAVVVAMQSEGGVV